MGIQLELYRARIGTFSVKYLKKKKPITTTLNTQAKTLKINNRTSHVTPNGKDQGKPRTWLLLISMPP